MTQITTFGTSYLVKAVETLDFVCGDGPCGKNGADDASTIVLCPAGKWNSATSHHGDARMPN